MCDDKGFAHLWKQCWLVDFACHKTKHQKWSAESSSSNKCVCQIWMWSHPHLLRKKKKHVSRDLTLAMENQGYKFRNSTKTTDVSGVGLRPFNPTSGSQGQYQHQFYYGPNIGDKYHTWVAIWTMIDMLVAMRGGRSANHHWWLCLKMSCPQNSYEECENDDKIRSSNAFGNLEYHISRRTLQHV